MSLSPALLRLRDALTLAEEGREAFSFSLEVKTKSRLNQRGHWTKDSGEHARQRALAAKATGKPLGILAHLKGGGRLVVMLTRHAPRQLDSDNLAGALKSIRDGVAESLGVSDAESGPVTWLVDQGKATAKETRVGVAIWLQNGEGANLDPTDSRQRTSQGGPFPAVMVDSGDVRSLYIPTTKRRFAPIPTLTPTQKEGFWRRVKKPEGGADGCWEWLGGHSGNYPAVNIGGAQVYAHRVAYTLVVGPIPEGLILLHSCRGRCVNPAHLRPGTDKENAVEREALKFSTDGQTARSAPIVARTFPIPTTLEVVAKVAGEWVELPDGRPRPADWREDVNEALRQVHRKADWRAMAKPNVVKARKP